MAVEALEGLTHGRIVLGIGRRQQIHRGLEVSLPLLVKQFRCVVLKSVFIPLLIYVRLVRCADRKKGCALINSLQVLKIEVSRFSN